MEREELTLSVAARGARGHRHWRPGARGRGGALALRPVALQRAALRGQGAERAGGLATRRRWARAPAASER
jgi:hypothetical protein